MKYFNIASLQVKIILSMSFIVILFLGIFQTYKYNYLKNQLKEDLDNRAYRALERLVNDLKVPLWELDEDLIKILMESEAKLDDVHAIYIKGDNDIDLHIDKGGSYAEHESESCRILSKDVIHKGKNIGTVKLIVTYDFINDRLTNELQSTTILAAMEIIIIIVLLWVLLNKIILSPVEALVKSTQLIADGHYSNVNLKVSNDEFGLLQQSIQKMSEKIASRERDIIDSAKQLNEVKEQLELAINGTRDGLWDWNLQTDALYLSPPWKAMLGYEDDELENNIETWRSLVNPEDEEQINKDIKLSQSREDGIYENMHRLKHKNGSWVWILTRGKTIFDKDGKAVRMVGFHTDLTKQKTLENELREQEELIIAQSRHAAMGEMISMIAHQWRQPLSAISTSVVNIQMKIELGQLKLEDEDKNLLLQYMNNIHNYTQTLSTTINDFRNFYKPNKRSERVTLETVCVKSLDIIKNSLINNNINVIEDYHSNHTLEMYTNEMIQVVINLLKNALDNFLEKDIKDPFIKITALDKEILVCDNGGGIPDEIMGNIFDVYFSTKDEKNGTGLGLYMSKIIVEEHHNAALTAYNTDDGACFKVVFK